METLLQILLWLFQAYIGLLIIAVIIGFIMGIGRVIMRRLSPDARVAVLEARIKQLQEAGAQSKEIKELQERIKDCQEKGRLAVQQRDQAREELENLRKGKEPTRANEGKFKAAKVAFARLYHPDNIKADGIDKIVRTEIFKEFWKELEAIEKST